MGGVSACARARVCACVACGRRWRAPGGSHAPLPPTHPPTHPCTCAQAVGKVPVDVNSMNIDLMSISGHKLYGPKGIGALYVRRRPRVRLEAQMSGGGQERGLRSGTVPAPLAVGACGGAARRPTFVSPSRVPCACVCVRGVRVHGAVHVACVGGQPARVQSRKAPPPPPPPPPLAPRVRAQAWARPAAWLGWTWHPTRRTSSA